ncbi:IS66 family transposase zinc-finger binding domain-containing protein [Methylomonas sp. MV1]|nr:IS66 family transposase zinc-finger binding domain-containing protein [Methylomonas sp. MV1]MDT4332460.1 IS66 family transposase zinc-finger binding domain-containing protein [Methylomonas sp. MV1]
MEIDANISEQLDIVPQQIHIIQYQRIKYACPCCDNSIRITPPPARIIPKGLLTEPVLAWVVRAVLSTDFGAAIDSTGAKADRMAGLLGWAGLGWAGLGWAGLGWADIFTVPVNPFVHQIGIDAVFQCHQGCRNTRLQIGFTELPFYFRIIATTAMTPMSHH